MSNRNSGSPSDPGQQPHRSIGNQDPRNQQTQRSEASRQQSQQGQSSRQPPQQGRSGQQSGSNGPQGSRNVRSQVERQDQMSQQGNPGSAPGNRSSSYGMGSQGEGSSRQAGTSDSPNQSGSMGASRRDDEDDGISRR